MLVGVHAQVHDLPEVHEDGAVGGLDLVPALLALAQRGAQLLQLRLRQPDREHLTALEPDRPAARRRRLLAHACTSAGSTSSVSTPPEALGCRNATREDRIPMRGCSSIIRTPASRSPARAASMSPTW